MNGNQTENEKLCTLVKKLVTSVCMSTAAIVIMLCMVVASNVGRALGERNSTIDISIFAVASLVCAGCYVAAARWFKLF